MMHDRIHTQIYTQQLTVPPPSSSSWNHSPAGGIVVVNVFDYVLNVGESEHTHTNMSTTYSARRRPLPLL